MFNVFTFTELFLSCTFASWPTNAENSVECNGVVGLSLDYGSSSEKPTKFAVDTTVYDFGTKKRIFGPSCKTIDGVPHITFEVDSDDGSSYYVVNTMSKKVFKVDYETAKKLDMVIEPE